MSSDKPRRDDAHSPAISIDDADTSLAERHIITALSTPSAYRHHGLDATAETYGDVTTLLQSLQEHATELAGADTRTDITWLAAELESLREDLIRHAATEQASRVEWTLDGRGVDYPTTDDDTTMEDTDDAQ